jgi:tRNA (adenine57-N1/adenine58-N1)-methyltransferase
MSFVGKKDLVEKNDTVILYLSVNTIYALEVVDKIPNKHGNMVENKFQTIYGVLTVMDLVGKRYGSRITLPRGWCYLLHPTCELWTKTVVHRTQIIYTPDISMIIFGLDLKPGSKVVEAGTGTGSLSHALIRTVFPAGHLYTFDFHQIRADLAREEFRKHGLSEWVTVRHRDVITDGFEVDEQVDAVFLDLPSPWDVVPHVRGALKRCGKLCTFSPCIEQVQKTCEALKGTRAFENIRTLEVLQRPLSVQQRTLISFDLTPAPVEDTEEVVEEITEEDVEGGDEEVKVGSKRKLGEKKPFKLKPVKRDQCRFRSIIPPATMPGHTGYLTFATMILAPTRNTLSNTEISIEQVQEDIKSS